MSLKQSSWLIKAYMGYSGKPEIPTCFSEKMEWHHENQWTCGGLGSGQRLQCIRQIVQCGSSTTSRKDRRSGFISKASSSAFGLYQTLHSKGQHKD